MNWFIFMRKLLEPKKYSAQWFNRLSVEDLKEEREKYHHHLMTTRGDPDRWLLLEVIDRVIARRVALRHQQEGYKWTPPAHREHGWYLSNDD